MLVTVLDIKKRAKKEGIFFALSISSFIPSLFSSVTQSCPTLYNPMDYSRPGFPVHHQLPELAQTHVH